MAQKHQETLAQRSASQAAILERPLSADDCVRLAREWNLDLRVKRLLMGLADEAQTRAFMAQLPSFEASAEISRTDSTPKQSMGPTEMQIGYAENRNMSIGAVIPILDWGLTRFAWKIAEDRADQQRLVTLRAAQMLEREVRQAHAALIAAHDEEPVWQASILAAKAWLLTVENRHREGLVPANEVQGAKSLLAQAKARSEDCRFRQDARREELANLLGIEHAQTLKLAPAWATFPKSLSSASIAALMDVALTGRPELAQQDLEHRITELGRRQAIARFFPRLDASLGLSTNSPSMMVEPTVFRAGVRASWSLLDGAARWTELEMAKIQISVQDEQALALTMGITTEVHLRALALNQAFTAVEATRITQRARRSDFERSLARMSEGLDAGTDTARVLADFASALLDEQQALRAAERAWLDLRFAAAGHLNLQELQQTCGLTPKPQVVLRLPDLGNDSNKLLKQPALVRQAWKAVITAETANIQGVSQ
jgi:outer membrane protein TolC